jgi:effector-binding domain-containing protein
VHAGLLPAGDYVTLLFRGHYDGLVAANAAVQQWGEQHGVRWAMDSPIAWHARIEQYLTDPRAEPDPARWETEIAYLIESSTRSGQSGPARL